MPLFAYFALVGPALLAFLFVAEAQLGAPKALAVSTAFHGLPKPFKAPKSAPVLTVRDAPAPELDVASAVAKRPIMAQATEATPRPERKAKRRTAAKKIKNEWSPPRNMFAHAPRREFGTIW